MHTIRIDPEKNRLYLTFEGSFEYREAKQAAEDLLEQIKSLKPGFDVITDISKLESSSVEAGEILIKGHESLAELGMNRIVRVVGKQIENVVGKVQVELISKTHGISAENADSIMEAEYLLDNQ